MRVAASGSAVSRVNVGLLTRTFGPQFHAPDVVLFADAANGGYGPQDTYGRERTSSYSYSAIAQEEAKAGLV